MEFGSAFAEPAAPSVECCVQAWNVPENIKDNELMDFFNGALVVASDANVEDFVDAAPCVQCKIKPDGLTYMADVAFRTVIGAELAVCLSGIECRGAILEIRWLPQIAAHRRHPIPPDLEVLDFEPEALVAPPERLTTTAPRAGSELRDAETGKEGSLAVVEPHRRVSRKRRQGQMWYEGSWHPRDHARGDHADGSALKLDAQRADEATERAMRTLKRLLFGDPQQNERYRLYKTLELQPSANPADIRKAYLRRCRALHPDKHRKGLKTAQAVHSTMTDFCSVVKAYKTLSVPSRRAAYDRQWLAQEVLQGSLKDDLRAVAFVLRHFGCMPIQYLEVEPQLRDFLLPALHTAKTNNNLDTLMFKSPVVGCTKIPLLVACGVPGIEFVDNMVAVAMREATGQQAPLDGVVIIVPLERLAHMQMVVAYKDHICVSNQVSLTVTANRIIVRGGPKVTNAVAMVQWCLGWAGDVLTRTGCTLNAWSFAYVCEKAAGQPNPSLVPTTEPDAESISRVLGLAMPNREGLAPVQMAVRVCLGIVEGVVPLAHALLKVMASDYLFTQIRRQEFSEQARYVCALMRVLMHRNVELPKSTKFAEHPIVLGLSAVCELMIRGDLCRDFIIKAQAVLEGLIPTAHQAKPWTILMASTKLTNCMFDFFTWCLKHRQIAGMSPAFWSRSTPIVAYVLQRLVGPAFFVHPVNGVQRKSYDACYYTRDRSPSQARSEDSRKESRRGRRRSANRAHSAKSRSRSGRRRARSSRRKRRSPASKSSDSVRSQRRSTSRNKADGLLRGPPSHWVGGVNALERVEELLLHIAKTTTRDGALGSVSVKQLIDEVPRRCGKKCPGLEDGWWKDLTKKWLKSHGDSFTTNKKLVRLNKVAAARTMERIHERMRSRQMEKACAEGRNAAAMFYSMARDDKRIAAHGAPVELLRKCCDKPKALAPFSPALIMQAVVVLDKKRPEAWDSSSLKTLLHAAAQELYVTEERPSLQTVATAMRAALSPPFRDYLHKSNCKLIAAVSQRLEEELSEQALCKPPSAERFFNVAQVCAFLAKAASTDASDKQPAWKALEKLVSDYKNLPTTAEAMLNFDAVGFCRLATAVAVARAHPGIVGHFPGLAAEPCRRAMEHLAATVALHMKERPRAWNLHQLGQITTSYRLLKVGHERLFRQVAVILHAEASDDAAPPEAFEPEQILKVIDSTMHMGLMHLMRGALEALVVNGVLPQMARSGSLRGAFPAICETAILLERPELLQALTSKRSAAALVNEISVDKLAEQMRLWPKGSAWQPLARFREELVVAAVERLSVRMSVAGAGKATPAQLSQILRAASDACITQFASRGDVSGWSERTSLADLSLVLPLIVGITHPASLRLALVGLLAPFAERHEAVPPRIAVVCAVLLLRVAAAAELEDVREVAFAAEALASAGVFELLPAAAAALVGLPVVLQAAASTFGDHASVCILIRAILKSVWCLQQARVVITNGDLELAQWVAAVEKAVHDAALERECRAFELREIVEMTEHTLEDQPLEEALGPEWAIALLIAMRGVFWDGDWDGQARVRLGPPKLPRATLYLAEHLCGMRHFSKKDACDESGADGNGIDALAKQPQLPHLLVRGGQDQAFCDYVSGCYVQVDIHHGRPAYKRMSTHAANAFDIFLYYWEKPDGQGWWFAPMVGAQNVWLSHQGDNGKDTPPEHGWTHVESRKMVSSLYVYVVGCPNAQVPMRNWEQRYGPVAAPVVGDRPSSVIGLSQTSGPACVHGGKEDEAKQAKRPRPSRVQEDSEGAHESAASSKERVRPSCNAELVQATASPPEQPVVLTQPPAPTLPPRGQGETMFERGPFPSAKVAIAPSKPPLQPRGSIARMMDEDREDAPALKRARTHLDSAASSGSDLRTWRSPLDGAAGSMLQSQVETATSPPTTPHVLTGLLAAPLASGGQGEPLAAEVAVVPTKPPVQPRGSVLRMMEEECEGALVPTELAEGCDSDLRTWLLSLDGGGGSMLRYEEAIRENFDGDLSQVAAAKVDMPAGSTWQERVDPVFWEAIRVDKIGHRMVLAKAIAKL